MIPAPYSTYNPQFSRNLNIQKLIERHQLEKILEDWEVRATGNVSRAKNAILDFHSKETTRRSANEYKKLQIIGCKIDCLPNIFIYPPFLDLVEIEITNNLLTDLPNMDKLRNLKALDLRANKFEIFPQPILSLEKLEYLNLNFNYLKECPDLSPLQNLIVLKLRDNLLTDLPKGMDQLSKLIQLRLTKNHISKFSLNLSSSLDILSLSDNKLTSLPSCIENSSTLRVLKITDNRLNILPNSFTKLQTLNEVHLSRNRFTEFPEVLFTFNELKTLYLDGNQLTSVPDLRRLENIQYINLQYNQLTTLPEHLMQLSEEVTIDVHQNQFSVEEVERIQSIVMQDDYEGPEIEGLSIEEAHTEDLSGETIEDLYKLLYEFAEVPHKNLSNLPNDSLELKSWLQRLGHVSEFRSDSNKKAIATTILSFLETADKDPLFRNVFLNVIEESSRTCGDRMSLSILKLDIYSQLEKADLTNTNQLYYLLLRGVYALDLLEECARKKLEELKASDDIETYLAYPIKLKEDLNLPFTQSTMRYFECSQVTDLDLISARNIVLEKLKDQKNCISFVSKQEKWEKSLSLICPKEWKKIKNKKNAALDESIPDYEGIQNTFYKDLEHLTEQVLSNSIDLEKQFLDNPLEAISNCLEKSKFNMKQATSELIMQHDNILSKIFTSTKNPEDNLRKIELLISTLCFLYEQTSEEKLFLFLLPSSENTNNVFSISSCIRDILKGNAGSLYSYLFCKLIEKETTSKENFPKYFFSEKNPLNKLAKNMNLLTRLTLLAKSAIEKQKTEIVDFNWMSNLISILECMEKFVSCQEKFDHSKQKRLKGSSIEDLDILFSMFQKLKKTIDINIFKVDVTRKKVEYTQEQVLDLVISHLNIEETQMEINNLSTNKTLLNNEASTSYYSKQSLEEKKLVEKQKLLTKQLEQLLIQKKENTSSASSILFKTFISKISEPVERKVSPINISYPNPSSIRDNSFPSFRSSTHRREINSSERPSTSRVDTSSLDLPTVPDHELERAERNITTRTAMMDPSYYKKV